MSWSRQPLKHLADVSVSNVDKKSEEGEVPVRLVNYTDVYYGDHLGPSPDLMEATASPGQVTSFRLRPGDVVITKDSETADDIGIPAYIATSADDLVLGYHLALLRPRRGSADGRYLYWAMSSDDARGQLSTGATGVTRFGLRTDVISSTLVPVPAVAEQRTIADFLDTETARIDALITKKRRMIELLEERFSAVIYRAITGADVVGPRHESGIEWIGCVPSHWGTPWLGAHYATQLGKMLNAVAAVGADQYPYLRNTNVQWDRFDLTDLATMHFEEGDRARCELRAGDLLVCEGGEVGRAAVWPGEPSNTYFQKAIHRVRPIREGNTRFLMYCLRAAAAMNVFTIEGNQSTIVHLTGEKLKEHRFPFPPVEEQAQIVEMLDRERDQTRSVTTRLEAQIRLLQEHRQALITAAVTGELDVPGVAAA